MMTLSSVGDEILGLKIPIKISEAQDEDDGEFFSSLLLVSYQLSSYHYKSLFFFCVLRMYCSVFFVLFLGAKHM